MAAGSSDPMTSDLPTTTTMLMTSRFNSQRARRRKSRKNSRRKPRPRPPPPPTHEETGTGNATSSTAHATDYAYEITTTPPTSGRSAADGRSRVPGKRRPSNRKLTAATSRKTGNGSATSSVYLLPIATAVPYVNVDAETRRSSYVTSGGQLAAWDETGTSSLATVVGLATVSVLAFWLIVTVVVLSCLLARRTKTGSARPRSVADSRWSWSGNQLIGLLDDSIDAPPPESARLFPGAERFDVSPPPRWNATAAVGARRRDASRTLTAYRILRQRASSGLYDRRYAPSAELPDSGYDTLAAAAAILDEPEAGDPPEVTTSYVNRGETEVWSRQREPIMSGFGCFQQGIVQGSAKTKELTSQRRFPKMGQSCLHRASPCLRPFTGVEAPARCDAIYNDGRPRLTGYTTLPPSDTTVDIGTTAV